MDKPFIIGMMSEAEALNYPRHAPTPSESAVKALYARVKEFEENLPDGCRVSCRLANLGTSAVMDIYSITELSSHTLSIEGAIDGHPATLIQDVSQVSLLLEAVPIESPNKERRPIGFRAPTED